MSTILDKIFETKRKRVAAVKDAIDVSALVERAREVRAHATRHHFLSALSKRDDLNIIAEFKKASPSKGMINGEADPAETARQYERAGASAISVLTEEDHFKGSIDDLRTIHAATSLPILRKDFIFDEFQIYEAAEAGADAILLIVASLGVGKLAELRRIAEEDLWMDVLVEVHTGEEMEVAASIGARLIGVNNRNLRTFEVSLDVSRQLVRLAPSDATLIAESGLRRHEELVELRQMGYSGFLIGESLMTSSGPEQELRRFMRRTSFEATPE